jgi:hypothetical protein
VIRRIRAVRGLTAEDSIIRTAYLILAHDQPALFRRLVNAVRCPEAHIYAHIDGKSDARGFAHPGVTFTARQLRVNHSGFSQVQAMLELLEAASLACCDYYVFLSGRDYPVASNREIAATLSAYPGRLYMNRYPLDVGADLRRNITGWYFVDETAPLLRPIRRSLRAMLWLLNRILPERRFAAGWRPYRGSTSWYLPRAAVDAILETTRERPDLLKFFRRVNCPDEIYFQTVVYNRFPVRDEVVTRNEVKLNLHHIDWDPAREKPAILDMRDYTTLTGGRSLFARKFDLQRSAELLDALDRRRA